MSKNIYMCWSGGKDSSLALYELRKAGIYNVVALLTTITEDYDRICMHGVRVALLEQQAESLGLPLKKVLIPKEATQRSLRSPHEGAAGSGSARRHRYGGVRRYLSRRPEALSRKESGAAWHEGSVSDLEARFGGVGTELHRSRIQGRARVHRYAIPRPLIRRHATYDACLLRDLPSDGRSLRRKRRVPFVRLRRTDFQTSYPLHAWRSRDAETATLLRSSCRIENCCSEGILAARRTVK